MTFSMFAANNDTMLKSDPERMKKRRKRKKEKKKKKKKKDVPVCDDAV